MEESEKMVALKKAYADIILNTAKEAAARVMMSERKAVRIEMDLSSTKEEALRLLVSLKQMIDSKTREAEITSLTQQRKIDELEAQLYEAEDVITDLRSELKWVRDKLEKVKNNQQSLNGQITNEDMYSHRNVTVEPVIPSILNSGHTIVTASDTEKFPLNQKILDNRCCGGSQQTENSSVSHLENYDNHKSNIAPIIMRNKEPELYRNGCTQRIRALERNLLDGNLPPLGYVGDQHTLIKDELIMETCNEGEGKSVIPCPNTKNMDLTKKSSWGQPKKPVKVRTVRRRKTRFGKAKGTLHRSRPGQAMKPCQLSSVPSHCKTYSVNRNVKSEVSARLIPSVKGGNIGNVKNSSDLDKKLQFKSIFNEDKIIDEEKRNMRSQSRDESSTSFVSPPDQLIKPCETSSVFNRGIVYSFALRGTVKSGEDGSKMKPLPRLDPGLTLIRRGADPLSGSTNFTLNVKALTKSGHVPDASDKETELINESALVKLEGDAVEKSMGICSKSSPEMVNASPVLSDLKDVKSSVETTGSPCKSDGNRFLKYTFQRKRKKESLSNSDVNTSPEKSIVKRRTAEKQNDASEPQKSTLMNESSRDSRRLAQVARQLISLSGRRW